MRSLFHLKNPETMDLSVFDRMKETAVKRLSTAKGSPYTQAIVLLSATGRDYCAVIEHALSEDRTDETRLLQELKRAKDTEICCALCLWQDGEIDLPSHAFRESLCRLDSKNSDTSLFVMTTEGVSGIKLSATMK